MEKIVDLQTETQHILVQGEENDFDVYLDDQHRLNSVDCYRFYEALVHPVMSAHKNCKKVLVLGGGNGCIVKELLKYPEIEDIFVVDNDEHMFNLFTDDKILAKLSDCALSDGKVTKITEDCWEYIKKTDDKFDVIIADYQLPYDSPWSEMYSKEFYTDLRNVFTNNDSLYVTTASSPTEKSKFFWSVLQTMLESGMYVSPYHQFVGSMGDCGFNIGGNRPFKVAENFAIPTKSLNKAVIHAMMVFGPDQQACDVDIITKENMIGYEYYNELQGKVQKIR
jgi:spermidine synthase